MASSDKPTITPDQLTRLLASYSSIIGDHDRLKTSIKSIMGFFHMTADELAQELGIPVTTLQYKFKQPDAWSNELLSKVWDLFRKKFHDSSLKTESGKKPGRVPTKR